MKAFASVLLLGLCGGCYLRPAWTNNPIHSPEGLRLTLLGDDCEDHRGEGDPISRDLGIKLRIDNQSDKLLRIRESEIRLVEGSTAIAADELQVRPHETAIVKLAFIHHSTCDSDGTFVIDWNDAFLLEDHPLAVANLAFRP